MKPKPEPSEAVSAIDQIVRVLDIVEDLLAEIRDLATDLKEENSDGPPIHQQHQ